MHSLRRISKGIQKTTLPVIEIHRHTTTLVEGKEVKPFSSIPGPPKLPVIGHLHLFSKFGPYSFEKLQEAFLDLHKKHGDIVRVDLGVQMVLLFRPEDLQRLYSLDGTYPKRPVFEALQFYRKKRKDVYSCAGLVSENGEEWRRLRDATNFMMSPTFASSYLSSQEKVAEDFVSFIQRMKNSNNQIPDFLQDIYRYTEEAIGLVCFGMRLGLLDESRSRCDFSAKLTQAADDTMQGLADTLLGFPWWKMFNTQSYQKLVQSQDFFQSFAYDCMKKAEMKLKDPAHEEDKELEFFRRLFKNEKLAPSDISLLMTEIFSAGIDATGNIIGFTLYNLTKRPDVQERLHQEIVSHRKEGHQLSVEKIDAMKFLKSCIKESYRLNPTSGGNARILSSPAVISGFYLPANVLCIGQNPIICREEKNFEKPSEYLPERWFVDDKSPLRKVGHPYCILPFSHGVRRCVGQRFAEQEIRLAIIKIIEKFRVEYDGPPIGSKMRMSLIPDKPLNFTFIER